MKEKAKSKECCEINDVDWLEMGLYLASHISKNRYVWTTKGGWMDMKHFLSAAFHANRFLATHGMVLSKGRGIEEQQARGGNISAWGVEDLPSNRYGVDFEPRIDEDNNCGIPDAVEKYINDVLGGLGAIPSNNTIDKMNFIRNFTEDPVLDPDAKDIHVDKKSGIPFNPHSPDKDTISCIIEHRLTA